MTTARRLALIVLFILLTASRAAPASAGQYTVYACYPGIADVNHSWVPLTNHGGMIARANCPVPASVTNGREQGLFTRHKKVSNPNATVPQGSFSTWAFVAPRGAVLASITYQEAMCAADGFKAGIRNAAGAWLFSRPQPCKPVRMSTASPRFLNLAGTRAVLLMTQCVKGPCKVGGGLHAAATLQSIKVAVADSTPPRIRFTGGSALTPGWKRGNVAISLAASDNVGVRHAEIARRAPITGINVPCDFTRARPCPDANFRFDVDTSGIPDGRRAIFLRAVDAAGNWATRSLVVPVDNTPPVQPGSLRLLGTSGWRRENAFPVGWINPPQPGTAPIVAVRYALCPASNPLTSWAGCALGSRQQTNISSLSGLRVPRDGVWVGRFWLRDAAGNENRASAASIALRLDTAPPQLGFLPSDANDPTRIELRATDAVSGLSRAEIEIRRRGDLAWLPLATTPSALGYVATLDDENLPDGTYDLRARAYDLAGNLQSTEQEVTGRAATRPVPARIGTRLVAGQVKRVVAGGSHGHPRRIRQITIVRPKVGFGKTIPIHGRLTTPGGNPVANANIEVWEQLAVPGAEWRRVAIVATSGSGRLKFKAVRGPSRHLRFRYPGTPLVRARTALVDIRVRASSTLRIRPKHVVNGEEITLRGRVRGGPLPAVGKLLQLQAFSRGRWLTFATPRASALHGRWSYRYRFTSTRGTVRYRFRARIPQETGFPYDAGVSRSAYVLVRGL
jgi:hypothetical protein